MYLTERETDKLVTILNHVVEKLGYDVETNGFGYSEDEELNIFAIDEYDVIDFESGLDFLIDELGIEYTEEELREMMKG